MKKSFRYFLIMPLVAVFAACCPEEPVEPDNGQSRTVLVYIVGTDNLRAYFEKNISDMETGMAGRKGNLIVYYDPDNDVPKLWKIDPVGGRILLETYEEENSASKEVLRRVVNRVFSDPAYLADSYGICFGGHSTGWIPAAGEGRGGAVKKYRAPLLERHPAPVHTTRSFGIDKDNNVKQEMNIADLAVALPGNRQLDFILFDDCFMSGIEALYDLRKSAKYIISSPAEVMGPGFPYASAIPVIFDAEAITSAEVSIVAQTFMDYYKTYQVPSGLITVVDTEKLEALAFSAWEILRYDALEGGIPLDLSGIQSFEKQSSHVFFDLDRYMLALAGANHTLYTNLFRPALEKAVVYCGYTSRGYSNYGGVGYYNVNHCCGITSFIPQSRPDYTSDYMQTAYMVDYNTWWTKNQ